MPKIPFKIKFKGPSAVGKGTCLKKIVKFLAGEGYEILMKKPNELVVYAPCST